MKRLILLSAVSALLFSSLSAYLFSPLSAQLPPTGYIGLFAEGDHSAWCVQGPGFYQVNMWVWCLPSEDGQICAEFGVRYPANVIRSTITTNTAIWMILPNVTCEGDICYASACYVECQVDWHWVYYQMLLVTDASQSYCEIVPHPMVGVYRFANCLPGYPVEPCKKYTNFYINYPPSASECQGTAAESRSWGSIKSLLSVEE